MQSVGGPSSGRLAVGEIAAPHHLRWPPARSLPPATPIPDDAPTLPRLPRPAPVPDWIRDALRKYALRIRDWTIQTWMVTHSPRRFMTEWMAGTRDALNPLRFLAVGTTLTLVTERAARWFIHLPTPPHEGWLGWFNGSLGQMLNVAVTGAFMHLFLRWKSKALFRSTLAAAVFAAAGPGALSEVAGWLTTVTLYTARGHAPLLESKGVSQPVPVVVAGTLGFAWVILTTAAVHRVRWWAPILAFLASLATITVGGSVVAIIGILVARKLGLGLDH